MTHFTLSPAAKIAGLFALVTLAATGSLWYLSSPNTTPKEDADILSRNGLHWHANLTIIIKGEQQDIPQDIGIGAVHQNIHTHDPNGVIHLEFPGLVRKNEVTLGSFFRIWNKRFNQECIFDRCNGPEGTVKFFVNGSENTEWENYPLQDNDKLEIRYE